MPEPVNILTRYAITKRMQKLLKELDSYFKDAADSGFTVEQVDSDGALAKIRKGLVNGLERERQLAIAGKIPSGPPA